MVDKSLVKKKTRKSKIEYDENGNPIEEPSVVAQRLINIFKQLHVFNETLQKDFDNMLLSTENDVRAMFETFPGGIPVREYLEELEENAGIIKFKEDDDVSAEEKSKAKVLAEALAAAQDKNSEKSHLQALELAKQQAKFMAEAQAETQKNLAVARANNDHHAVAELEQEIQTGEQKLAQAQAEASGNVKNLPAEALGEYQPMMSNAPVAAQGDLAKEIVTAVTEVMKLTEEERRKENQELIRSINKSPTQDLTSLIKQAEDGKIEISQDALMADTFSDSIREMERNRAMENKELIRSMTETQMKIASLAFEKNKNSDDGDAIKQIGEMLVESQKAQAEEFSKVISDALSQTHDNSIKSFSDALTSSQENSINLQAEALSNALANNSGKSADAIAEALSKANQENANIIDSINNTDKSPGEVTNALNKALSFGNKIKNAINIKDVEEKPLTENQIDELSKSFKEETPEIQNEIFNETIVDDEFEINIDEDTHKDDSNNDAFENLINDDMSSLFLDDDEAIDLDGSIDDIKFDDNEINLEEELVGDVDLSLEDDDFEYVEEIDEDDEEYEYVEEEIEVESGDDEEYEYVEEDVETGDDEEYEYVEEEVETGDDEEYEYVEEEVEADDDEEYEYVEEVETDDDEEYEYVEEEVETGDDEETESIITNRFNDKEIEALLSDDDLSIELDDIESEIQEEEITENVSDEDVVDDEEYEWVDEDEESEEEYEWVEEDENNEEEYEWVEEDEDGEEEYEWVEEDEEEIEETSETNDIEIEEDDNASTETNFSGDYEWVYDEEYEESLTGNTDEEYEWVDEDDNENVWDELDNNSEDNDLDIEISETIEKDETSEDEEYEWVEEDEDSEEYEWIEEDEEAEEISKTEEEIETDSSTEIAIIADNEVATVEDDKDKETSETEEEDYLWKDVEKEKDDEFEDIHDDNLQIIEEDDSESLFPDYLEDTILDEIDPYENYVDQLTYYTENKQDKSTLLIDDFLKFEPYFIDSNDDNEDYDPYENIDNGNVATAIYVNTSDDQKAVKYKKTKDNEVVKENSTENAIEKQSKFEDENLDVDPYESDNENLKNQENITYKNNDDDPYSV